MMIIICRIFWIPELLELADVGAGGSGVLVGFALVASGVSLAVATGLEVFVAVILGRAVAVDLARLVNGPQPSRIVRMTRQLRNTFKWDIEPPIPYYPYFD